jgi:hypothetical protein
VYRFVAPVSGLFTATHVEGFDPEGVSMFDGSGAPLETNYGQGTFGGFASNISAGETYYILVYHNWFNDSWIGPGYSPFSYVFHTNAMSIGSPEDVTLPTQGKDPQDGAGVSLIDSATQINDGVQLTTGKEYQTGAVWMNAEQSVASGFETTFQFRLGDQSTGIAFVINPWGAPVGGLLGGLGYAGIPDSLAVGFDSNLVYDTQQGDTTYTYAYGSTWLNPHHISVHTGGTGTNQNSETTSLGLYSTPSSLDDGLVHTAKIVYVPGTLTVYLDNLANPVLTVPVDLSTQLALDAGQAYVGFTAENDQGGSGTADVLSWGFGPAPGVGGVGTPDSFSWTFGHVTGIGDVTTPTGPSGSVAQLPSLPSSTPLPTLPPTAPAPGPVGGQEVSPGQVDPGPPAAPKSGSALPSGGLGPLDVVSAPIAQPELPAPPEGTGEQSLSLSSVAIIVGLSPGRGNEEGRPAGPQEDRLGLSDEGHQEGEAPPDLLLAYGPPAVTEQGGLTGTGGDGRLWAGLRPLRESTLAAVATLLPGSAVEERAHPQGPSAADPSPLAAFVIGLDVASSPQPPAAGGAAWGGPAPPPAGPVHQATWARPPDAAPAASGVDARAPTLPPVESRPAQGQPLAADGSGPLWAGAQHGQPPPGADRPALPGQEVGGVGLLSAAVLGLNGLSPPLSLGGLALSGWGDPPLRGTYWEAVFQGVLGAPLIPSERIVLPAVPKARGQDTSPIPVPPEGGRPVTEVPQEEWREDLPPHGGGVPLPAPGGPGDLMPGAEATSLPPPVLEGAGEEGPLVGRLAGALLLSGLYEAIWAERAGTDPAGSRKRHAT